jgi:hypothetical protein
MMLGGRAPGAYKEFNALCSTGPSGLKLFFLPRVMDHRQESTVALGANPDAVVKSFAPDAAPMRREPKNMPWESVPERTLGNSLFAT